METGIGIRLGEGKMDWLKEPGEEEEEAGSHLI